MMTRIDFYLLPDSDAEAKRRFACRLAYKAASNGSRVHIRTEPDAVDILDVLIWEYPLDQFLPHRTTGEPATEPDAPVVIGAPDDEPCHRDLLVNIAEDVPTFLGEFERAAEIVLATERSQGRERYRAYRDQGFPLEHHELGDWE